MDDIRPCPYCGMDRADRCVCNTIASALSRSAAPSDDARVSTLLPRAAWPDTYTAAEAKAWIAAMDAAEGALFAAGLIDEWGHAAPLAPVELVDAAREIVNCGPAHDAAHWGLEGHPTIVGADCQQMGWARDTLRVALDILDNPPAREP